METETPLSCSHCERTFKRRAALASHQRTHGPKRLSDMTRDELLAVVEELRTANQPPVVPQRPNPAEIDALLTTERSEDERKRAAEAAAFQAGLPKRADAEGEPGTYKVVAYDKQGNAAYAKVPWTRAKMEARYPMVTIIPWVSRRVTFAGVTYNLAARQEITVPSIIAKIYSDYLANLERENSAYPILSTEEERRVTQGAMENKMAFSRVFKSGVFQGFEEEEVTA